MATSLSSPEAASAATAANWLYDFWYPALPSERVRGRKMVSTTLLGIPLVLGRNASGNAFALRDSCPHRGIPLSFGHFDGRELECCYHGWRFEPCSGQCKAIPSLTADSKLKVERIFATAYACQERDGFFWVYFPEPGSAKSAAELPDPDYELPDIPRVPLFSEKYTLTHLSAELPCSVDHGIIGLMDPAHGPFVHQSWWWRGKHSIHEKAKQFEPIPRGFRMSPHQPSANSAPYRLMRRYAEKPDDKVETTIDFALPNLRYETVRCGSGWFSTLTTVTPITADRCRIDVRAAWNIYRVANFLTLPIGRFFGKKFIRQDQQTMEQQAIGLKHNPKLMLIDDADRPAKWYFALKQAYLDSRRTGQPMKHPMTGPVTLRWRS